MTNTLERRAETSIIPAWRITRPQDIYKACNYGAVDLRDKEVEDDIIITRFLTSATTARGQRISLDNLKIKKRVSRGQIQHLVKLIPSSKINDKNCFDTQQMLSGLLTGDTGRITLRKRSMG